MKHLFTADLHGNIKKYQALFQTVENEKPDGVFIGGDLLPNTYAQSERIEEFLEDHVFNRIQKIRSKTNKNIRLFIILGNDDPRSYEDIFINADKEDIIDYVHFKTKPYQDLFVTGYSYVPPTPFQLKDWERYDVSRYVDPGGVSPEEGRRTIDSNPDEVRFATIKEDLEKLIKNAPPKKTIFLFHSPPYKSNLDRAALDGKMIDSAPLDVHVGSIAIQRFIQKYQPLVTLHGHIHETVRLTGSWKETFQETHSFTGAHEQHELSMITFDERNLKKASRIHITL